MKLAVLSDTHGLLRPEVARALERADLIVHAGDVGNLDTLEQLRNIAPIHAVRGNVDRGAWATPLPETLALELGGHTLYVLHNLEHLDLDPTTAGFSGVIYGHTHQPKLERREGVLYLNPGSVGPRRFSLPVRMAWLGLEDLSVEWQDFG